MFANPTATKKKRLCILLFINQLQNPF